MQKTEHDPVNHPTHYASEATCSGCGESIECIDVVRHLEFNLGNAIKYLWRAGKKDDIVQDLKKAVWYIQDQIAMLEGQKNPNVHRLSRTDEMYNNAMTHVVGQVDSVTESDKGLEVAFTLKKCKWDPSQELRDTYAFRCDTHGFTMYMPIDKAPEYCTEYENLAFS